MLPAEKDATRPGATPFRVWRRDSFPESRVPIRMSSACRSRRSRSWSDRFLHPARRRAILACDPFPEVLMTHRYIKIGATTAVLVLAFTGLLWSTLREGTEYYKHVDEGMTDQQAWQGKRLQ